MDPSTIIASLGSLGLGTLLLAVFNWFTNRGKSDAELTEMLRGMSNDAVADLRGENKNRDERIGLLQWKVDHLVPLTRELISELEEARGESLVDARRRVREIELRAVA